MSPAAEESGDSDRRKACVVVLGDLGHSPRMCNHAVSLADEGFDVDLVGFAGSGLPATVVRRTEPRRDPDVTGGFIRPVHVRPFPAWMARLLPGLLVYVLKTLWHSLALVLALPGIFNLPALVILQNPPSIPALVVCAIYCHMCRVYCFLINTIYHSTQSPRLVIDWHNYGHTILELALGPRHPLVRLSKAVEASLAPTADAAFCVSKAMKDDLERDGGWVGLAGAGSFVTVLYDRPAERFRPISMTEKHEIFSKLGLKYSSFAKGTFTASKADSVHLVDDRPGLLVSSTSWTEDEDFKVLLEALDAFEAARNAEPKAYPRLVCAITGKGPLKEHYKEIIRQKDWRSIKVVTPWLEPEDYPRLLAAADLGVCLHTSSSGLDLPMKVVDMFGCGLPVVAMDFPALPELVRDGHNGYVVNSASEMSSRLLEWFRGFPVPVEGVDARGDEFREEIRRNLEAFRELRWEEYWRVTALPVIEAALRDKNRNKNRLNRRMS